jgi:hypothetical protein
MQFWLIGTFSFTASKASRILFNYTQQIKFPQGTRFAPAISGQAPKATLQVIPAGEPESRTKTILFFLCLIL